MKKYYLENINDYIRNLYLLKKMGSGRATNYIISK